MRRCLAIMLLLTLGGCATEHISEAPHMYYGHWYNEARDMVRADAADRDSPDVVLNNLRLGLASLAWGDLDEAERSLLVAYEYLSSGQINDPAREVAAKVGQEAVRVWTGEPYERAMSFYYLAALYMLKGDWPNARAAARNSLFKLRDIQADDPQQSEFVDSQFLLGYLLLGLSQKLSGNPEAAKRPFDHVAQLAPDFKPLVDTLWADQYDTLLLVDMGRGPNKVRAGPGGAYVRFVPDGRHIPPFQLAVRVDGQPMSIPTHQPVVDTWTMSQLSKWWSLDTLRQNKAMVGEGLAQAGLAAVVIGAAEDSTKAVLAGAGAIVAGLLLQSSAKADVRHLAELPRHVYLVPLTLGSGRHAVHLDFDVDDLSDGTWHDLVAGRSGDPRVYYLRMHDGNYRGMPHWLDRRLNEPTAQTPAPGTFGYEQFTRMQNLQSDNEPAARSFTTIEGPTERSSGHESP